MIRRIFPIAVIFFASWIAWGVLAGVMDHRSYSKGASMRDAVGGLWGSTHLQHAPLLTGTWSEVGRWDRSAEEQAALLEAKQEAEDDLADRMGRAPRTVSLTAQERVEVGRRVHNVPLPLNSQKIDVDFDLDQRKKGLLWFSTYTVRFDATYMTANPLDRAVRATIRLPFPASDAVYDGVTASVEGRDDAAFEAEDGAMAVELELAPGEARTIRFAYTSRGQDEWRYSFGSAARTVRGLDLTMTTDFDAIDFPPHTISPDSKERRGGGADDAGGEADEGGWVLSWKKDSMVSDAGVGMIFPKRINPGPFAASISSSAPISLFFFFFVVFILEMLRDIKLHPMHYFFFAASFFSFNLLFAYSVDHLAIVPAFALSAAVSLALVVPYAARVVGLKLALGGVATSQLLYQVVFAVAHFFEGFTGLTVTVGAIATLAAVMHGTAKIDWQDKFIVPGGPAQGPGDLALAQGTSAVQAQPATAGAGAIGS